MRGWCVLEHVGQPFLNRAVGRLFDLDRNVAVQYRDLCGDFQPSQAGLRDELGDAGERAAGVRSSGGQAEHVDEVIHLGQRPAAGGADPLKDLRDALWVVGRRDSSRSGLHDHHGHVVADDVVQLARDSGSLSLRRQSSERLPLALEARLAFYRFALPRDATDVAASPADCALRATVTFPNASIGAPGIGASDPHQPTVASAVLGDGGCVSMLLSDPYTPGGANMPEPAFPVLDSSPISIAGDQGTVGTYEFIGSASNGKGVPLNGAKNVEVTVQIPAGQGQFQMLLVAAAGVSEQQLESIVASGLNAH